MSDWQVGDLAVCVDDGRVKCDCGRAHNNSQGRVGKGIAYRVVRVVMASEISVVCALGPCHCEALVFDSDNAGLSRRFRKIRPDEQEACEPEFVTLLERIKRRVPA